MELQYKQSQYVILQKYTYFLLLHLKTPAMVDGGVTQEELKGA